MDAFQSEIHPMEEFSFDVHIFKEGDMYIAYVPALDVSSCGATDDEARAEHSRRRAGVSRIERRYGDPR